MRLPRPFARNQPTLAPAPKPQIRPVGGSGRWHTDGFLQYDETNPDLVHPQGTRVYDQMWRTDPDVRRAWSMWMNPIQGATWSIEPHGGDDATDQDRQAANLVEWALTEHLRGGLHGHLSEALRILRHGFAPFEQIWHATHTADGQLVLVPMYLGARLPRTIQRFIQDEYEQLQAIEQLTLNRGLQELKATELVYYRVGTEGDNWEGESPLRAVYKPWFFKDGIERLDAIAQERHAVGITVVYPPTSADDVQLDAMEEIMADLRGGETAQILMPGPKAGPGVDPNIGWEFGVVGMGSASQGGRDAQPSLQYHSDKIAAALIAEFMRLGQSGVGARATADVQQDPFWQAVEGFASTVIEPELTRLAQRICEVNFESLEGFPKVKMSLVDSTSLTELAEYVTKLRTSEALQADDPLEDYLRDKADLPPADPKVRAERARQADVAQKAAEKALTEPAPAPGPGPAASDEETKPEPANTAARTFRQARPLRHWEQHMSLDTVEAAIDGARARFETAGADAARDAVRTILAQVLAGKTPTEKPPADLVNELQAVLEDLYTLGRSTVVDEMHRQTGGQEGSGVLTAARIFARDAAKSQAIRRRAQLAARNIMSRIITRVLGLHVSGGRQDHVLQVEGEKAAGAALRAQGQEHAAAALNAGRTAMADQLAGEIRGSRYTSILDGNACPGCRAADDDVLRPLNDPVRLARIPPNAACDGGDRCRCMEAFEFLAEAPPAK